MPAQARRSGHHLSTSPHIAVSPNMSFPEIPANAPVVGADGVSVGITDGVNGRRLKIKRPGALTGKKHFVDLGLVAGVENGTVRLSANADVVVLLEDDED